MVSSIYKPDDLLSLIIDEKVSIDIQTDRDWVAKLVDQIGTVFVPLILADASPSLGDRLGQIDDSDAEVGSVGHE